MPDRVCAEYDWSSERETLRANIDEPGQGSGDRRSAFERDWARIIHSSAFRGLQGKTQIFAPATADYLRTRVTHSIEVAQIGRALAERFGVPPPLVEAACLGHDLGHPPFGHTGEAALDGVMDAHGGFEGNAQTFHIVTKLEQKHPDYDGLDLCRGTLLSLIKYPFRRGSGKKYLYDDDAEVYGEWLYEDTDQGLLTAESDTPPRTIAAQLMDWADDIAYSVHDLEDGILSGYLEPATWGSDRFLQDVHRNVREAPVKWVARPPSEDDVADCIRPLFDEFATYAPDVPMDVIRETSRRYIDRFMRAGDVQARGAGETSFDFAHEVEEEVRVENQVLKSITFEFILRDPRTVQIFHKGERIILKLFKELLDNATVRRHDQYLLFPRSLRGRLEMDRDNQSALARRVCDYVASMTEGQALRLYTRLFEPFSASEGTSP